MPRAHKDLSDAARAAFRVTITASGHNSGSATTGLDGTYSTTLPPGSYTVQPKYRLNVFTPKSRPVNLKADISNVTS